MAIYLDNQTGPYLKMVMKQRIKQSEMDFIAKRVLSAIEADEQRKLTQLNCQHEEGEFVGKKTCCVKCEALFKEGQGFEWTNKNL